MTKRSEFYSREYKYSSDDDPENRGERHDHSGDNILKELAEMCIELGRDDSTRTKKFGWFDEERYLYIEIGKFELRDTYKRQVSIQIMPRTAKLPRELTDLLKKKGFKKQ